MIIRSTRPTSHFSIIENSVVRDTRLSFKARGILLEILSRPDNWRVSAESLSDEGQEGRYAILGALEELRAVGYMVTVKERNKNGQFITSSYVYGTPQIADEPKAGNRESDNLTSIEVPIEEEPIKEEPIKNLTTTNLASLGDLFQEFWEIYPRSNSKPRAETAFGKALKRDSFEAIMAGVKRFASDPNRELQFTPYGASWLNSDGWNDPPCLPRKQTFQDIKDKPTEIPPKHVRESREGVTGMPASVRDALKKSPAPISDTFPLPADLETG